MSKDLELWRFIESRLSNGESVMLLVVAASSGSSPGRAGYKMAVAADGELIGSIGGGLMEVNLAEAAKRIMASGERTTASELIEQVHRKDAADASGMICSGKQTVIRMCLSVGDLGTVQRIVEGLQEGRSQAFEVSDLRFQMIENTDDSSSRYFSKASAEEFVYQERLDQRDDLLIIGGGHCAFSLSDVASKLGFRITIFDDRPKLNTLAKNQFADQISIIDSYDNVGEHIPSGVFVVVMTLGYMSDAVVIRNLIDREFKYFGVLGSKAKMATLMTELRDDGFDEDRLARIRTPIGLPINSRTPEEIAVSIAAELIAVRNS